MTATVVPAPSLPGVGTAKPTAGSRTTMSASSAGAGKNRTVEVVGVLSAALATATSVHGGNAAIVTSTATGVAKRGLLLRIIVMSVETKAAMSAEIQAEMTGAIKAETLGNGALAAMIEADTTGVVTDTSKTMVGMAAMAADGTRTAITSQTATVIVTVSANRTDTTTIGKLAMFVMSAKPVMFAMCATGNAIQSVTEAEVTEIHTERAAMHETTDSVTMTGAIGIEAIESEATEETATEATRADAIGIEATETEQTGIEATATGETEIVATESETTVIGSTERTESETTGIEATEAEQIGIEAITTDATGINMIVWDAIESEKSVTGIGIQKAPAARILAVMMPGSVTETSGEPIGAEVLSGREIRFQIVASVVAALRRPEVAARVLLGDGVPAVPVEGRLLSPSHQPSQVRQSPRRLLSLVHAQGEELQDQARQHPGEQPRNPAPQLLREMLPSLVRHQPDEAPPSLVLHQLKEEPPSPAHRQRREGVLGPPRQKSNAKLPRPSPQGLRDHRLQSDPRQMSKRGRTHPGVLLDLEARKA